MLVECLDDLSDSQKENEKELILGIKPEFDYICSNAIRSCILHLLLKAKDLNHTLRVEEIAHRLGKRHSVIIHHLEKLQDWKIVKVVKNYQYGDKYRRSIWGLNLEVPNLIQELYLWGLKRFYTQNDLEEMCNINRNTRDSVTLQNNKIG